MEYVQTITALIATLIALAAIIWGPRIQLQIAERQIRAQLVSANRMRWIEEVRSHVARFLTQSTHLLKAIALSVKQGQSDKEAEAAVSMEESLLTVRLLLDPQDSKHEKLRLSLEDLHSYSLSNAGDLMAKRISPDEYFGTRTKDVGEKIEAVQATTREVLKTEWERVKRGE